MRILNRYICWLEEVYQTIRLFWPGYGMSGHHYIVAKDTDGSPVEDVPALVTILECERCGFKDFGWKKR